MGLLKKNKYIKKLPDFENRIKKLNIRFKKHPESRKFSDKEGYRWTSYFGGRIEIPIRNKSIIPSDAREQFGNYAHEEGHIKKGHCRKKHPCREFGDCLSEELEAEMNSVESSKKIGEDFGKDFWLNQLSDIRDQCKDCLKVIKAGRCSESEMKKIKKHLNIVDRVLKLDSRKIFFPEKGEEKEHQMILKIFIKSDSKMKKLIENENIKEKGIKFAKHPESHKFCDTPTRIIWRWVTPSDRKILIPLDKDNSIMPYDKNDRIFNLGHEFGHIELGIFSKSYGCGYNFRSCLSVELKAHVLGIKRWQKINARFGKIFWRNKLLNKWFSCKECLGALNQGKCPKKECEKIKKSLCEIAKNVKE